MLNIVSKRKIWYILSSVLVIASILSILAFGLKLGIDYIGGTLWQIKTENKLIATEVRSFIAEEVGGEAVAQPTDEGFIMRFKTIDEDLHQKLVKDFEVKFGKIEEIRFESIGPVIGAELKQKSMLAMALVVLVVIIYIAWAFRKVSKPINSWKYGILTVVSLLFACLLPVGLFALLGRFYGLEIGSPFIAAILTVAGYSINDTIVVFDRVRENVLPARFRLGGGKEKGDFEEVVNDSINQTIARSINTSLTTLMVLAAVYFFGGETIKYFALALIVGVAAGAYSSIFLASPLLVSWYKHQYK